MTDGEAYTSPIPVERESVLGGPSEIASLYDQLAAELRRFLLGVLHDHELTDDVMQSTFILAIEHGHQARPETARGWLFQVAFREALAARRRQGSKEKRERKLADLRTITQASPDEGLLRSETIDAVRQALSRIPEEQRDVILARMYEDKTFAQIAREKGLPLGTVLTRMRRGLEKMKTFLRPGA